MSLLIEGVDMPKCCCDCYLYDSAGFCALDPTRGFEDYNHKRPDDCTLVEIPTPHGRLIDADALLRVLEGMRAIENVMPEHTADQVFELVIQSTLLADTIIEAEAEE